MLAFAAGMAFSQTEDTPDLEPEEEGDAIFELCISGGPGATSCSNHIGGGYTEVSGTVACSITCNINSYACCDYVSCKCKPYYQSH